MRVLNRLKCAAKTTHNWQQFYKELSGAELAKRKASLRNIYVTTTVSWMAALTITVANAKIDIPLVLLYGGVVFALLIIQWAEYKKRVGIINELLKLK